MEKPSAYKPSSSATVLAAPASLNPGKKNQVRPSYTGWGAKDVATTEIPKLASTRSQPQKRKRTKNSGSTNLKRATPYYLPEVVFSLEQLQSNGNSMKSSSDYS